MISIVPYQANDEKKKTILTVFCFDTDQVFESLPSISSAKTARAVAFRFHSLVLVTILNQNSFRISFLRYPWKTGFFVQ